MNYHDFMGHVQNRARLGTTGEAVHATRATLNVLSQRLYGDMSDNLAAQLPEEIGDYLKNDAVLLERRVWAHAVIDPKFLAKR